MFPDMFNDDAFSVVSLTAFVNSVDFVPGRAGELAFSGVSVGVATDTIAIEQKGTSLSLIPTTARAAPAPQEAQDKGRIVPVGIPQIKLEDTIGAYQLFGQRQMGTAADLVTARVVIEQQLTKMMQRHDLTLENLRLGALHGRVRDADGSVLLNLYSTMDIQEPTPFDFTDVMTGPNTEDGRIHTMRTKCHEVIRYMKRNIKAAWPSSARVHAFAGDNMFDAVVESTREVYDGYAAAERRLGDSYAHGIYEFGGIYWENYQGTDDNETVAININGTRFFVTGVPGLYEENNAPADFFEEVGEARVGVPRYAKVAPDGRFNRFVYLHTQQNTIPLCTRPATLVGGVFNSGTGGDTSTSEASSESEG